jgi:hypothetical protein
MTKEQLVEALTKAVGGSAYGDALIDEAAATFGDKDKKIRTGHERPSG